MVMDMHMMTATAKKDDGKDVKTTDLKGDDTIFLCRKAYVVTIEGWAVNKAQTGFLHHTQSKAQR
jgi:hypothetical protein